jgi:hypothetical protein
MRFIPGLDRNGDFMFFPLYNSNSNSTTKKKKKVDADRKAKEISG